MSKEKPAGAFSYGTIPDRTQNNSAPLPTASSSSNQEQLSRSNTYSINQYSDDQAQNTPLPAPVLSRPTSSVALTISQFAGGACALLSLGAALSSGLQGANNTATQLGCASSSFDTWTEIQKEEVLYAFLTPFLANIPIGLFYGFRGGKEFAQKIINILTRPMQAWRENDKKTIFWSCFAIIAACSSALASGEMTLNGLTGWNPDSILENFYFKMTLAVLSGLNYFLTRDVAIRNLPFRFCDLLNSFSQENPTNQIKNLNQNIRTSEPAIITLLLNKKSIIPKNKEISEIIDLIKKVTENRNSNFLLLIARLKNYPKKYGYLQISTNLLLLAMKMSTTLAFGCVALTFLLPASLSLAATFDFLVDTFGLSTAHSSYYYLTCIAYFVLASFSGFGTGALYFLSGLDLAKWCGRHLDGAREELATVLKVAELVNSQFMETTIDAGWVFAKNATKITAFLALFYYLTYPSGGALEDQYNTYYSWLQKYNGTLFDLGQLFSKLGAATCNHLSFCVLTEMLLDNMLIPLLKNSSIYFKNCLGYEQENQRMVSDSFRELKKGISEQDAPTLASACDKKPGETATYYRRFLGFFSSVKDEIFGVPAAVRAIASSTYLSV